MASPLMNLIAYGSLMHRSEFAALAPQAAIPVWVRGFRRAFDQRPMWRNGGNREHTVLAVRHDPAARFNGVLLLGIASDWVATLDYRERGYIRTPIPNHRLEPFDLEREEGADIACPTSPTELHPAVEGEGPWIRRSLPNETFLCDLYVGRAAQHQVSGAPLEDYHALVRQACASWGTAFAKAFEQTTALTRMRQDR